MQSDSLKKSITIEAKNGNHKLKVSEYARWFCLIEALDIISRKAQQFKVDLQNKDADWVKPLAFQKYIDERYESMVDEVLMNESTDTTPVVPKCITSLEPALK
jgi:hypothetical protein